MLCARRLPNFPRAWDEAQGLADAPLRKICAARDAVSQGVLRACMGSEAAHLLVEDAEEEVRAVRMQGVWRPPADCLTTCRAHRAASGAIMPVQSGRSGPSSSKHAKSASQTTRRRPRLIAAARTAPKASLRRPRPKSPNAVPSCPPLSSTPAACQFGSGSRPSHRERHSARTLRASSNARASAFCFFPREKRDVSRGVFDYKMGSLSPLSARQLPQATDEAVL